MNRGAAFPSSLHSPVGNGNTVQKWENSFAKSEKVHNLRIVRMTMGPTRDSMDLNGMRWAIEYAQEVGQASMRRGAAAHEDIE